MIGARRHLARERCRRYRPLWSAILGGLATVTCLSVQAQVVTPPDPASLDDAQPQYLELVVNQKSTRKVVRVLRSGDGFRVAVGDLRAFGLPVFGNDSDLVTLNDLSWLKFSYDENNLRLLLEVPADMLPMQYVGDYRRNAYEPATSGTGAIFNYDAFVNAPSDASTTTSIANELRLFGPWGSITSSGTYSYGPGRNGYTRFDTRWEYSDPARMLTFEAGDMITRGLSWNSTVRLGGVGVSRNFAIRPDVVTYPLPVFSGEAAVPSTLDVFIAGQKIDSRPLEPGPFTLTSLPYINGAGEAVVVTTDVMGRQVSTTLPFYVSSSLLADGFMDYSIAAGALRQEYGRENFAYGDAAVAGSLRYGLSDRLTLETHAEHAQGLQLGGVGAVMALGHYGVVNASYASSQRNDDRGRQTSVGYQYSSRRFSVAIQDTHRDRLYADLAAYPDGSTMSRRTLQATGAFNLFSFGNVGLGYFDIEAADGTRSRLGNLSWSRSFGNSYVYLSGSRDLDDDNGWSFGLQWLVSLGDRRTAHAGYDRNRFGKNRLRFDYDQAVPTYGGLGWQLGVAREPDGSRYGQAGLHWRNPNLQLRVGVYGDEDAHTVWGNATGSLVWMDGGIFPSNRINDAFVLVTTDGQPGVRVRYENQLVGTTDRNGRLLVPWVTAWYAAKYEIEAERLPAYMQTPVVEQRVAVRGGSGQVVRFPLRAVTSAVITVHDEQGNPMPVGTVATTADGQRRTIGWDGVLYLESVGADNEISIDAPTGRCVIRFEADTGTPQVAQIGPLVCRAEARL
ncbi:fimbria/pilus outer membrane usher protein [Lysobacter yangpyeongensis]|uniref:Fimbria/pilus outer membrane usher protein n=1 Tax=Lysobacter yangpyeongensis TaxID=346182 RepID=A0ABW0SJ63_9GAMM